jgi:hypothetical protein
MKFKAIAIIVTIFLIAISGLATADVLPKPVPENQVFTTTSIVEAVGLTQESTSLVWWVGDAGITELPPTPANEDGTGALSRSIAYVAYSDSITTNGGQISEVKSFSMDTRAKTAGLYNIQTSKVLTYTSQNGSHLMGAESYVLDVAGNWSTAGDDIICVFAKANNEIIPAFCNKVTASSKLTSITTAQVETIGEVTAVADKTNVPAVMNYQISVTPDANSASGYADGIVSTTFTLSVMEGRSDGLFTPGKPATDDTPGTYDWTCFNKTTDQEGTCGGTNPDPGSDMVIPPPQPAQGNGVADDPCENNEDCEWRAQFEVNPIFGSPAALPTLANYSELASTVTVIDTATVAGGISTFNKAFSYQSGYRCTNC